MKLLYFRYEYTFYNTLIDLLEAVKANTLRLWNQALHHPYEECWSMDTHLLCCSHIAIVSSCCRTSGCQLPFNDSIQFNSFILLVHFSRSTQCEHVEADVADRLLPMPDVLPATQQPPATLIQVHRWSSPSHPN